MPIVTLSDEILEHVTLLKLDVQGAEPRGFLRGQQIFFYTMEPPSSHPLQTARRGACPPT